MAGDINPDHQWASGEVFVFGANEAGRHGKFAAQFALKHCGARYGQGFGRMGNSFGIPTKDVQIRTLPLPVIANYIRQFLLHAAQHPGDQFFITRVGCGAAGYEDKDIAPLFATAPVNCRMPPEWEPYLPKL